MIVDPQSDTIGLDKVKSVNAVNKNFVLYIGADQSMYVYSLKYRTSSRIDLKGRPAFSQITLDDIDQIVFYSGKRIFISEPIPKSLGTAPASEIFSFRSFTKDLGNEMFVDIWNSNDIVFGKTVDGTVSILDPFVMTTYDTGRRLQNIQYLNEDRSVLLNYYGQVITVSKGKVELEKYLAKQIDLTGTDLFFVDEDDTASHSSLDGRSGETLRNNFTAVYGRSDRKYYGLTEDNSLYSCDMKCSHISSNVIGFSKVASGAGYFFTREKKIYFIQNEDVLEIEGIKEDFIDIAGFGIGSFWILKADLTVSLIVFSNPSPSVVDLKRLAMNYRALSIRSDDFIKDSDVIVSEKFFKEREFSQFRKNILKTGNFFFEINGTSVSLEELLAISSQNPINFSLGRDGRIWISVSGEAFLFSFDRNSFYSYNYRNFSREFGSFDSLPNIQVGAIISDRSGRI